MKKLIIVAVIITSFFCGNSFAAFWPYPRGMQYCTGEGDGPRTSDIQRIWRSSIGGTCAPTIVDGRVYINNNGLIYCLSILDGTSLWKSPFNSQGKSANSPCGYYEGKIYFGNASNKVFCLDAYTGKQIWVYNAGLSCDSQVTIVYGRVIIGAQYKLLCLDYKTGKLIWQLPSKNTKSIFLTQRLVYQNKVYTVLDDDLCIYDIMSGKLIKKVVKVRNNYGCLLLGNNIVMKSDNQITAVNKDTNILYRTIGGLSLNGQQSCVAKGKYICTTNDNKVLIFDTDLLNNKEIDLRQYVGNQPSMLMSPISSNGLVFLGTKNSKLIIINTSKYSVEKVYEGTEYNYSSCSASKGVLFICNTNIISALIEKQYIFVNDITDKLDNSEITSIFIFKDIVKIESIKVPNWIKIKSISYDEKGAKVDTLVITSKLPRTIDGKAHLTFCATDKYGISKTYSAGNYYSYFAIINIFKTEVYLPSDSNGEYVDFELTKNAIIGGKTIYFFDPNLIIRIITDALNGSSTAFKENVLVISNNKKDINDKQITIFMHSKSTKNPQFMEGKPLSPSKRFTYANVSKKLVVLHTTEKKKTYLAGNRILSFFGFVVKEPKNNQILIYKLR